jgi:TrpR-related protein YerC/YecD
VVSPTIAEESPSSMPTDRLRTPEVDNLLRALLAAEDTDEAYSLLLDLCTVREIQEMAQRLQVAQLLSQGEHYTAIQEATGASATTISRVSKALNYGADGYRRILERLGEEPDAR